MGRRAMREVTRLVRRIARNKLALAAALDAGDDGALVEAHDKQLVDDQLALCAVRKGASYGMGTIVSGSEVRT